MKSTGACFYLRLANNEVRIFPLLDLNNQTSKHLEPVLKILEEKGFETEIVKTNYEFQKGANEMLRIHRL